MIPIEPIDPVDGNAECIELLEKWLTRARLGEINCIALVAVETPTRAFSDHAGVNTSHFAAYVTLDHLKNRLIVNHQPTAEHIQAPIEKNIPANFVCFDCNNEPTQFDFLPWLLTAEMTRRREGAPEPLKVCFIEGRTNEVLGDAQLRNRDKWMEKIVLPICRMVGAELTQEAYLGRRPSCYSFVEMVRMAKNGEEAPRLSPTPEAAAHVQQILGNWPGWDRPIVITLREALHWPHRNSNVMEWLKFADKLRSDGEKVIFVRDTIKADEGFPEWGFPTLPLASRDLDIRFALYERARCNFFVDNGPMTLAWFGSSPFLAFVQCDPMTSYLPNTPQWWKRNHGIKVGEQFPWFLPHQRIIWGPDTFEAMCTAWDDLKGSALADAVPSIALGQGMQAQG